MFLHAYKMTRASPFTFQRLDLTCFSWTWSKLSEKRGVRSAFASRLCRSCLSLKGISPSSLFGLGGSPRSLQTDSFSANPWWSRFACRRCDFWPHRPPQCTRRWGSRLEWARVPSQRSPESDLLQQKRERNCLVSFALWTSWKLRDLLGPSSALMAPSPHCSLKQGILQKGNADHQKTRYSETTASKTVAFFAFRDPFQWKIWEVWRRFSVLFFCWLGIRWPFCSWGVSCGQRAMTASGWGACGWLRTPNPLMSWSMRKSHSEFWWSKEFSHEPLLRRPRKEFLLYWTSSNRNNHYGSTCCIEHRLFLFLVPEKLHWASPHLFQSRLCTRSTFSFAPQSPPHCVPGAETASSLWFWQESPWLSTANSSSRFQGPFSFVGKSRRPNLLPESLSKGGSTPNHGIKAGGWKCTEQ